MNQEIERKFLIKGDFRSEVAEATRIKQGYLSSAADRTVRVRIRGNKGFITIKGKTSESGLSRFEWEKEIPVTEAEDLLLICEPGVIDKTRYEIIKGRHVFEVDEFHGLNSGLLIAELELSAENESFERPDWLGEEVTGDARYYNSSLVKKPFTQW